MRKNSSRQRTDYRYSTNYLNILNQDGWVDDWSLNETIVYLLDKENVNNNVLQNVTKFIESHQNYAPLS